MQKTHSKLLIASLIFLIVSCSDNPTGPVHMASPSLLPLAKGAHWNYSFSSIKKQPRYGPSAGSIHSTDFGQYDLTVENLTANSSKLEIELKYDIKIDSVHVHDVDGWREPQDTSYTLFISIDTTYYQSVIYKNGSFWYSGPDSLEFMMLAWPAPGSAANLKLFVPIRYQGKYDTALKYSSGDESLKKFIFEKIDYDKKIGINAFIVHNQALFMVEDGGLNTLTLSINSNSCVSCAIPDYEFTMTLQEYTPGSPE